MTEETCPESPDFAQGAAPSRVESQESQLAISEPHVSVDNIAKDMDLLERIPR